MKGILTFSLILSIAGMASGCNSQGAASRAPSSTTTVPIQDSFPTVDPSPSPTPTASASPSPTPISGDPVYQFRVGTVGYNSDTVTVAARRTLKIRFTPGIQDEMATGTGYTPNYSRLGVFITVGAQQQITPMLTNGYIGAAQQSPVLDYSSTLTNLVCVNNPDVNCREQVSIVIDHPNYDYWCLNFGQYCPWTRIHDTHPWNGQVFIQTDDTRSL
jgi:hypothetical protein